MSCRQWLISIILAAVLERVAFIALFDHTLSLQTSGYDTYAVNVMERHGYTRFEDRSGDSDLPPLYPAFLVIVYTVLGRDPVAVALVQIAFYALTILLLFWIGWRVAGETVGWLAAAFYGLYPYLLFQNLTLNDTGIFILLLTAGVAAAYQARDHQDWRWAVVAGLCLGLGALTKSFVLLMLPLLALWWWRENGLRAVVRLSAAMGIACAAVVAPWVARSTQLHGEFVFISTNGGSNLHQGNNACVDDYLVRGWDAQWVNCLEPVPDGLSEAEADRWHREQVLAYLRENPGDWLRSVAIKFYALWSPMIMPYALPPDPYLVDDAVLQYNSMPFQVAQVSHVLYFGPLLVLAVIGWWRAWRQKLTIGPLVMVLTVVTVTYLMFHPSTRYRSPADPFLFILAAYACVRLVPWEIGSDD